ncbi:MAG: VacJ family lipoprotein [Pseudomonadales bacterium]|nr:VacJ family lipoprotein [Pseudomonadales bacterium]
MNYVIFNSGSYSLCVIAEICNRLRLVTSLIVLLLCNGYSTVGQTIVDDPFEARNRERFESSDSLDASLMIPAAESYVEDLPRGVRLGVSNFFGNLFYPNTMLNNFLQGKFIEGVSDVGRLVVNTTLGVGGIFDVATALQIPIHEEDFGQTLAVWGVDSGSYLYLPLFGPYTERYTPDLLMSGLLNPLFYTPVTVMVPLSALYLVNRRAEVLVQTEVRDESALDRYLFTRDAFIQRREFLIYDGNVPTSNLDDFFDL